MSEERPHPDRGAAPSAPAEEFPQVPPPPQPPAPPRPSGDLWKPTGQRLHPAAMAIWPLGQVGPLVFLLVIGTLPPSFLLTLMAFSLGASVVRYLRFTWRLDDDALVIEQGLLERKRRVIPIERVQTVDIVRKVRHRLFGVVEARIEAIGGGSTEGSLDAVAPAVAERLRARLLATSASGHLPGAEEAAAPAEQVLAHLTPGRLVAAGLTGGRVGVAAALLGFAQQALGPQIEAVFERLPAMLGATGIIGLAALTLIGAFLLSIAATVLTFWNFTLTATNGALRVRRGLLEQRSDTVPLRRVQAIRIEENFVRRFLGLAAVKVDVAGRAGGDEGRETGLLLPLGTRADARALVERVLRLSGHTSSELGSARTNLADIPLRPAPGRARTRRLVRAVAVTVLAAAPMTVLTDRRGVLVAAVILPVAVIAALDAYRALGYAERAGVMVARAGVLVRRTAFVPIARLQSLALTATPFQRLRRLGTLDLQIARSPGVWSGPQVRDLDAGEGRRLLSVLAVAMDASRHAPAVRGDLIASVSHPSDTVDA